MEDLDQGLSVRRSRVKELRDEKERESELGGERKGVRLGRSREHSGR